MPEMFNGRGTENGAWRTMFFSDVRRSAPMMLASLILTGAAPRALHKERAPGSPGLENHPFDERLLEEANGGASFAFELDFAVEAKLLSQLGNAILEIAAHLLFLFFGHVAILLHGFPHSAVRVGQEGFFLIAPDLDLAAEEIGFEFRFSFDEVDRSFDAHFLVVLDLILAEEVFEFRDSSFTVLGENRVSGEPLSCHHLSGMLLYLLHVPCWFDSRLDCCRHRINSLSGFDRRIVGLLMWPLAAFKSAFQILLDNPLKAGSHQELLITYSLIE